jgi:Protein of unknown function, DUF481
MKTCPGLFPSLRGLLAGALALLAGSTFAADRIELIDGSVILGQLVCVEGGKFKVETDFAGTIEIVQDKVRSFSTEEAVNVELASGSQVLGSVGMTPAGIVVAATDGQMSVPTARVTAVWRQGADSPEIRKQKRHWKYEAALAVNGRTGQTEKFAGALGFKATLESAQDKLIFNLAAEKARDSGVETANRQLAGADYSSFLSDKNVWYARTSIEKDEIKELDLRSITAFGMGRKLIKQKGHDLEVRFGVSYLYESYANGTKFDSPGLDLGLIHSYVFKHGKLSNALTYTPAFKDFGNYRIHHESSYEVPLTASLWKLKVGLTNDYVSIPPPGIERLDTLYFTSLILNWE